MLSLLARSRMLLNATLPKIFQRKVLRWLPPELGQYVLDAGRPFSLAGEIALVRAHVSLHPHHPLNGCSAT